LPILFALAVARPAMAIDIVTFENDYEEEIKPWSELQTTLPGAPKEANMVRIDTGPAARATCDVDKASVSAGADGVVRYSVVIQAAGGARTVNYEGMRCATGEWKIYAFGRPDGSWARNRYARWTPLKDREIGGYHRELYYHYFCTVDGRADKTVIDRALRDGGIRRGESTSF
jgi:hypothetical protein